MSAIAEIKFNPKYKKYEGWVDGRIESRCSTIDKVIEKLDQKGFRKHVMGENLPQVTSHTDIPVPMIERPQFSVEQRFEFIENFVSKIARGKINSLVLTGSGGLGKTHTVLETLRKLGKIEEQYGINSEEEEEEEKEGEDDHVLDYDFTVIKGYSTAKAMYRTLYVNNGKIIIFDDADSVHRDPVGQNILKSALDSHPKRIVCWGAETDDGLPSKFVFTGRVIFISNLSIQKFPQPLISRSIKVDLTLNFAEKMDRIQHVFKKIDADKDHKKEVVEFIREHGEKFTDLNIRSALNVLALRQDADAGGDWRAMALYNATA